MTHIPKVGLTLLRKELSPDVFDRFEVQIVRSLDQLQQASAIRSVVFMSEQDCPYIEEFDGNDLTATHFVGYEGNRPVATLRIRWFAEFAKLERICVLETYRGTPIVKLMLANCFEFASRKGYRLMIGQIQTRLVPLWSNVLQFEIRKDRPALSFSNYTYTEIDITLPVHPDAIRSDADAYVIIRPEGAWDDIGVLEEGNSQSLVKDTACVA
jgi:predicted GNAT family N-acyltransferase